MGQCLVVAGGSEEYEALLDPQRGVVLKLPEMVREQGETTMVEIPHQGLAIIGLHYDGTVRMNSLPCVNLSLTKIKMYLQELECRQHSSIPFCVHHTSDGPQGTTVEVSTLRAPVECLCHSLLFYYLFQKGGHVPCVKQQQSMQQGRQQSLLSESNSKTSKFERKSLQSFSID